MSRLVTITTEGTESLAAATAETLLQARGVTGVKYELAYLCLEGDQQPTTEVENVAFRLLYQTTDGTGSAATEQPGSPDDPTPALTAFHSFSAEPTAGGSQLEGFFPANGGREWYWAEGEGYELDNATSSRLGVEVNASAAIGARATMRFRVMAA